jgi:ABC-type multidrug transport system fused ATPase/permease subunit
MNDFTSKRKIVLDFMGKNKFLLTAALFSLLLSNVLSVILSVSIGWFYEIVLHEHGTKNRLLKLFPIQFASANQFYGFFAALLLLRALFVFFEKFLSGISGERFSRNVRELAFSHQLRHSLTSHRQRPVGKYLLRYSGDLLAIQNLLTKGTLVFIGDVFFVLTAFACLFFIQQRLASIVIILFFLSGGIIFLLSKVVRTAAWNRRRQRSQNLGFVSSRLQAFFTIKSFNRETPEEHSFVRRSRKLYRLGVKFITASAFLQSLLPLFFFSTLLLVFYEVGELRSVKPVGIATGDVLVFVLLLLYMQGVMKRLLKVNLVWQVGLISFDKLLALIQLPSEVRRDEKIEGEVNGGLSFEDVSFAYHDQKPVLHHFSCYVFPHSITLIKGKQGSGKSTILKLSQKIYEPQSGRIVLDELDYASLSAFQIRKHVTLVSPEAPLLGNTAFEAVSYNTADEKREKVATMFRRLKIHFADSDKDNLDFKLEDGGQNISAGQRMMLQFARAFLTRKQIILLDEPFAYLDDDSRNTVIEQLNKLKKKRTVLVVAETVPEDLLTDQIINM